jgi:hypothetical protein
MQVERQEKFVDAAFSGLMLDQLSVGCLAASIAIAVCTAAVVVLLPVAAAICTITCDQEQCEP